MKKNKLSKALILVALMVSFLACTKEDEASSTNTYTITVGAFTLDNGIYTATGNELVFDSD